VFPKRFPLLSIALLLLTALVSWAQGQPGTTETLVLVRFETRGQLQMDVWLDGKRAGFTPFKKKLAPGKYYLTAAAEALQPIMQELVVGVKGDQVALLPTLPLTVDNQADAVRRLIQTMQTSPPNRHFTIIGLFVSADPSDLDALFAQADRECPGDPVVALLRARRLVRAGKSAEAAAVCEPVTGELPLVAFAWRVRAEVLLAQGDSGGALDAANEAVVLEPQGFRNLRVRARVHEAMGSRNAAANDQARAEELYGLLHKLQEEAAK
jgi:tetratricopeptide (TPR) repeat protein